MDEDTLNQFLAIARVLRRKIYSIQMPQAVILDLDSTLLDAYGRQEGRAFNFHCQSNGYHPLVCYDGSIPKLVLNNYSLKILYTYFSLKSFKRVLTNILSCSSPSCWDYLSKVFLMPLGTNHCFIYPKTYRTICCNYFHLITQKIFCELYFLNFIPWNI